jgi:NAD(P)-dependent dehydrogenase (short-subunit alcohol dehydrogenase family)
MKLLDGLLDRSIFFSFDRSGYLRHQRRFDPADLERSLQGQVYLVTGANSGLGYAVSHGLAERGAAVHLLCRSAERGAAARDAIRAQTGNPEVYLEVVDVSSLESVAGFVAGFSPPRVDALVHNAGVLPDAREVTPDGLERTVATHLVGPFLLTRLLAPRLQDARVVFVSSGGMYTKRLDVDALTRLEGRYDGVEAYAQTKRGQVVLSEQLARELAASGTTVNAMHPGWAATPGVERSLPRFWRAMESRLRTPEQGADTALWLAVAERVAGQTGLFWFDRRPAPTHLLPRTREQPAERQRLWDLCARHAEGWEASRCCT